MKMKIVQRRTRGLTLGRNGLSMLCVGIAGCAMEAPRETQSGQLAESQQALLCGGDTPDWQDVELYTGSLGPTTEFVSEHQGAVGVVNGYCTGTLITHNLFLTAGHCFENEEDATTSIVTFDYQKGADGAVRDGDAYAIVDLVEHVNDGVNDYAIVRLEGGPGFTWGIAELSARTPLNGEALTLIQHPDGLPKVVEGGNASGIAAGSSKIKYANLDTLGGSSGSGILDQYGQVIGVHYLGGCHTPAGANEGTRMDSIMAASSMLGGGDRIWNGKSNDTFTTATPVNVDNTFVAVGGDFDADGHGDIFWYGRGTQADRVWYARGDGTFTSKSFNYQEVESVPVVGDFDGDGRSDVFWYGRGSDPDSVWYGAANRGFTNIAASVGGSGYRPVAGDFDGDGRDDIFWYRTTGTSSVWYGGANRVFTSKTFTVNGGPYRPVAGDFNGDGRGDVFLYGPGSIADNLWTGNTNRSFGSIAQSVGGYYQPFAADFDGDGRDDMFWYRAGSESDSVWYFKADLTHTGVSHAVSPLYTPITGRFDGTNPQADIFWYRPG
jgi:V8-like Glu-specific endopeptidase